MMMVVDDLDDLDVKAEVLVIFHQKRLRLQRESLVLSMMMNASPDELDVKAEAEILQQKKLHLDLKYFDVQIHL